jgi:hypothetical protein
MYMAWTPIFEWYVVRRGQKMDTKKASCVEMSWTTCLKYAKHSKFNSQHDLQGLIWPLNEHKNLHFDNE